MWTKARSGCARVRLGVWRTGVCVRVGFVSGRTIIFRYFSPSGGVARSKLRIAVARTDPPRQGQ